jgi:hypothetical protein
MEMVHPHPYPFLKNNGFLYRERILGVSGREGGYIGFGLDFSGPPANRSENPPNPQEYKDCWRFGLIVEFRTSDIQSDGRQPVSRIASGVLKIACLPLLHHYLIDHGKTSTKSDIL